MNNPLKYGSKFRVWLAYRMMRWAYRIVVRIDRGPVPKLSMFAFTFEEGLGAVVNNTGGDATQIGARLFYINDVDYERAHQDSIYDHPEKARGQHWATREIWPFSHG
ncbi:hypothetical protein GJ25_gp098 [Mycobacterium phage Hawkeye]|uniref:Uncharacterized protein n=1 Tax=Mycobacterium phage Hawkeye TaxID=1458711 RepID=X2KYZ3_9CAUD|nr:hypothetical protein GJ25_gp098 [Mycobacterium phage Hawkeye]AHN84109.1 hypothetical protein PBI_HAWKEYE_98 [Mycobacterium phage Hawkeye]